MPTLWLSPFFNMLKKADLKEAITIGAKNRGYVVSSHIPSAEKISNKDIYCCWNRHRDQDSIASRFELVGARVIVFENPYFRIKSGDYRYFSVSMNIPNTHIGSIPCLDTGQRFKSFGVAIQDWKEYKEDSPILIASQSKVFDGRSIGYIKNSQPPSWDTNICRKLYDAFPDRELKFRLHPNHNNSKPDDWTPLKVIPSLSLDKQKELSFKEIGLTVLHSSNCATDSLLNGVPVIYTGEHIFSMNCCSKDFKNPNLYCDRETMFNHMAWNQYNSFEIMKGLLFETMQYAENQ